MRLKRFALNKIREQERDIFAFQKIREHKREKQTLITDGDCSEIQTEKEKEMTEEMGRLVFTCQ